MQEVDGPGTKLHGTPDEHVAERDQTKTCTAARDREGFVPNGISEWAKNKTCIDS